MPGSPVYGEEDTVVTEVSAQEPRPDGGGDLCTRADAPAGAMRGHGACREGAGQGAHERKSFGMSAYPLGLSGNQT